MLYTYKIVDEETNVTIYKEENEDFPTNIKAIIAGAYKVSELGLNVKDHCIIDMPVTEKFEHLLKNAILYYSSIQASKLVSKICDYISAGGQITNTESKLLDDLSEKFMRIHTSEYELSTT